jgi:hypothetical protein
MARLEVDLKLTVDPLEAIALIFFIPYIFVVGDMGVGLPARKLLG